MKFDALESPEDYFVAALYRMTSRRAVLKLAGAGSAVGAALLAGCHSRSDDADGVLLDVAVIGAGLSGLVAARDLKRAGLQHIVVLEARNRVGGRTLNEDLGAGHVVEAGGAWVGPGQTAVLDLIRELGVETFPTHFAGDTMVLSGGRSMRIPTVNSSVEYASIFRQIDELAATVPVDQPWNAPRAFEFDAMTFGDYLRSLGLAADTLFTLEALATLTFGAAPHQLSFLYVLFYIRSAGRYALLDDMQGGAQQDRIVGGSQILSLKIAAELGDTVRTESPVSSISNWGATNGPCRIRTPQQEYRARQVILALRPSQSAQIAFTPQLPEQRRELMELWPRDGSGLKTQLVYSRPFWRDAGLSGQSISTDGSYLWSVDMSPPDASIGVLCTLSPSTLAGGLSLQQRRSAVTEALAKSFGPRTHDATDYRELDWAKEPYTFGCVSPLAPGLLTRCGSALRQPVGRIAWAGTETSPLWMGYMDGAVRAGRQAALTALGHLSDPTTST